MNSSENLKDKFTIREVWAYNLEFEFYLISTLIDHYSFISMDTEFPGVIHKPSPPPLNSTLHRRPSSSDHYKTLKKNVDALKLIQLGITLSDSSGNLPALPSGERVIWQFNFSDFDVTRDQHAPDSIQLLKDQGIDFQKNRIFGIHSARFAKTIMSSGLIYNDAISWVTFHSAYDFAYLVKVITRRALPRGLEEFLKIVRVFFGNNIYDVKHLMRFCKSLYGGLNQVAGTLGVNRVVGKCHQAGSDSLLTWHAFQKMRDEYFVQQGHEKYAGVVYGLDLEAY